MPAKKKKRGLKMEEFQLLIRRIKQSMPSTGLVAFRLRWDSGRTTMGKGHHLTNSLSKGKKPSNTLKWGPVPFKELPVCIDEYIA